MLERDLPKEVWLDSKRFKLSCNNLLDACAARGRYDNKGIATDFYFGAPITTLITSLID
jgi:hypothetical protein